MGNTPVQSIGSGDGFTERDAHLEAKLPCASTHIRLLHIFPSGQNDIDAHRAAPISCSFSVTPIASPAPYRALSYAWDDVSRPWPCFVLVDGVRVPVTRSLDTALRYMRGRTKAKTLWIDQLCINQADDVEKSGQISVMAQIYGKATRVLAWLGPEADHSDAVMAVLRAVGDRCAKLDMMSYYTRERLPILTDMLHAAVPDPLDGSAVGFRQVQDIACKAYRPILHSMRAWFGRSYFTRIWVVQEFALGAKTTLVCGTKSVPRQHVMMAVQILKHSMGRMEDLGPVFRDVEALVDEPTPAFFGAWRRREKFDNGTGEGDELFRLLQSLHVENKMLASDPRDRIYGLMGLAVDSSRLGISLDYANSTSASVLTETARAIARTGRLEILSYSQHPKDDFNLPTWVPEWGPSLRPSYYTIYENAEAHFFSAGGDTAASIIPTVDPLVLGLEGFTVDVIEQLESPSDEGAWDYSRSLALLTQASLFCQLSATKNHSIYESPARRAEAVWRVPIADTSHPRDGRCRATPEVKSSYDACLKLCELYEDLQAGEQQQSQWAEVDELRAKANEYQSSLSAGAALKMRLFLTAKGYLGLAPTTARTGDVAVVFNGARVPYVIRPVGDEGMFSFVGEAYCDGVMDGEVVAKEVSREFYLV